MGVGYFAFMWKSEKLVATGKIHNSPEDLNFCPFPRILFSYVHIKIDAAFKSSIAGYDMGSCTLGVQVYKS